VNPDFFVSMTKPEERNNHRELSPFQFRRGKSPKPTNISKRGVSPFRRRGVSPLRLRSKSKSRSFNSQDSHEEAQRDSKDILICHESARSIVFRDHLRCAAKIVEENEDEDDTSSIEAEDEDEEDSEIRSSMRASLRQSIRDSIRLNQQPPLFQEINDLAHSLVPEFANVSFQIPYVTEKNVEIKGLHTQLTPLPELELGPKSEFKPLSESGANGQPSDDWTQLEKQVFCMFKHQKACVKTIKNSEWTQFLKRFQRPQRKKTEYNHYPSQHDDIAPHTDYPFNSFVTSTSLLPEFGKKMRCYGSLTAYTIGVVFALPECRGNETEEEVTRRTKTWSWPAGYAAKTEFNIDNHGRLINGREEALVSLKTIRQYNDDYLNKEDHMIAGRLIKGGFKVIPYNEVFLRVGGVARKYRDGNHGTVCSFDYGAGLPVALFIRTITMGDIISLFRTRARLAHIMGKDYIKGLPLLYISNELGVRVFAESLQQEFWELAAEKLNPFQNPILEPLTKIDDTNAQYLKQKLEELIDIQELIQGKLSPKLCARIAGGFGATDESVATILKNAMAQDEKQRRDTNEKDPRDSTQLQTAVTEVLAAAVRSCDYVTARQILILYSLVASQQQIDVDKMNTAVGKWISLESASIYSDVMLLEGRGQDKRPSPSLPPPINTDGLRSAVSVESWSAYFVKSNLHN
jgi:hypothetical protein